MVMTMAATMRAWEWVRLQLGVLAVVGYLASGCGDAGAALGGGEGASPSAEESGEVAISGALKESGGCDAQLSPVIGARGPAALGASGPWQYCGAYGTGGAHIIKTSDDSRRTAVLTDSGQAWVLETSGFATYGPFSHGNGAISFVGLSPDGRLLATVDDPGARVGIWDVSQRRLLRVMQRPALQGPSYFGLGDVAFSRDGQRVAVVSGSHVDVFDVATGAPLPISARSDLGGAMRVAFAASNTASDAASNDRLVLVRFRYFGNGPFAGFGSVDVVDAATGDNLITLAGPPLGGTLAAMAVSGNGAVVAVGAAQPGFVPITFFDPQTGAVLGTVATAGVPLALDVAGNRLALHEPAADGTPPPLDAPQTISLRRTNDGTVLRSVTVPGSTAFPRPKLFVVTPDVRTLLVGDIAPNVLSHVRLSDGTTRAIACGSGHTSHVVALARTPDGAVLVSTGDLYDGNRRLAWDISTGAPLADVPDPAGLVGPSAVSPAGTLVAEPTEPPSSSFVLRDTGTGAVVRTVGPQPSFPRLFDFAPFGAFIASTSDRDPADRRAPPVANVWVVATGQLLQSLLIVTSQPEPSAEPLLFATPRRLLVGGYATTALWCR